MSEAPKTLSAKRNPPLTWDWPMQAQNLRQQARFLLMVEEAACGHPRWNPAATLLSRGDVVALLNDAGVRTDLLLEAVGDRHKLQLAIKWVGKTHWKQATPSKSIYLGFAADKFAIWSFVYHCSQTESEAERRARGDYFRVNHTELEGRHQEKLVRIHGPDLHLHWRHQVPACAEELVRPTGEWPGVIGDLSPAAYHRMAERALELTIPLEEEERRRYEADPMPDLDLGFDTPEMRAWWVRNMGYDPVEEMLKAGARRSYSGSYSSTTLDGFSAPSSGDYAFLGLRNGASTEEVKTAFRRLAKEHHPDAGGSAEQFRRVVGAYERITSGRASR
jgi:DnaJ-domain-containing protein 1